MKKALAICLILALMLVTSQVVFATVTLTGPNDTVSINGKAYVVQNNVWGASTAQTLSVNETTGAFTVTQSNHNNATNGAPASYPSIFKGSHWGNATTNSGLPLMTSNIGSASSSWSISTVNSGAWDAAYDIWFNTTASTSGQPNGAEMMIWINHYGPIQPSGSKVATVSIGGATWDVWYANVGWQYIAYVRTSTTNSVNLDLKGFFSDSLSRGYIQNSWYLIDVEAGFELWQGGTGMASNSFSFSASSGSNNTPTPTPAATATPTPATTSTPTPATTPTPTPNGGGTSPTVTYAIQNDWGSGATVNVTIKNNSSTAINGWTLAWTFPGNQKITNLWSGTYTQSGASVSVKNDGSNGTIPANGGTVTFGFNLSYSGSNAKPTSFTLNGAACQVQ